MKRFIGNNKGYHIVVVGNVKFKNYVQYIGNKRIEHTVAY
jgi:hypothetical protein